LPSLPDIPALIKECTFTAVRSSGKGGQHVNKVSTKVILFFDVLHSVVLDDEQKVWLQEKLIARINKEGVIQLNSSVERTQSGNRQRVVEKFVKLIEKAFVIPEERIPTIPTAGSRQRRLSAKKIRSGIKSLRSGELNDDLMSE
jgi:ribosome-associated protein